MLVRELGERNSFWQVKARDSTSKECLLNNIPTQSWYNLRGAEIYGTDVLN
jgi:hypothetical protein